MKTHFEPSKIVNILGYSEGGERREERGRGISNLFLINIIFILYCPEYDLDLD